ncbi:urate hydroxylase PuuD [Parasphingorhabdus sp.]|uniref:urate hydroxylase PuuD n=1 Tax=Parasphingorhabdus sp. TaxID=2709688 RepID=UPI0032654746
MAKFFGNLHLVMIVSLILTVLVMVGLHPGEVTANSVARWAHLFFGVLWIGLLYYFNFVQVPQMPNIPDEAKPAVSKHIAPSALFYFRWAALFTVITGLLVAYLTGYLHQSMTLQGPYMMIGVGMWIAIIMAANVWFIIWPNQKKVLGIVDADADAKAAAGKMAMMASRTNTLLSLPMFYTMVSFNGG